jgi:hypothetical protein
MQYARFNVSFFVTAVTVTYDHKMLYKIGRRPQWDPWPLRTKFLNFVFNCLANFHVSIEYLINGQYYKTFIGVIYTTIGAFPNDFD